MTTDTDSSLVQTFDELADAAASEGMAAAADRLAQYFQSTEHYHELFDLRLLQARLDLGLPAILTKGLDDLEDPLRTQMEDRYLEACREVGHLLLADGRVREAWMYLRPVGDRPAVAAALEKLTADEGNTEQIVEVALYEGVHPRLGFELVLKNFGLCNAITTYDAQMHQRPRAERAEVAALLVRQIHGDLLRSLKEYVEKKQGKPPQETTIAGLVADRDWLFDDNEYHIDTSHLAAVVRFALVIDEPDILRLAVDLTEYGRRLSPMFQYPGQEPFADTYPTHAMFFRALLGEQVDEALDYFRGRADALADADQGSWAAEVYVALLSRLGRIDEAFEAAARLLAGARTSGFAPSVLELAQRSGNYARLLEISRQRGDLLGFVMGLAEQRRIDQN
ncbi:MAG: hypothetical protein B7Z73_05610 [Planctomycetia bacterium 21-64-5]|nr:MAG: hypothetical protein B7Z73_05610 [Planctomycetia bacterium 21-64-5]HQU44187.1 hypothetical protein [Pirellulales bacterium]